jgi:hypothetical protein
MSNLCVGLTCCANKEFLAAPPLDMQAIRKEQEAQAYLLHVQQGAMAMQMKDVAVAQESFGEALRLDATLREAHLGMALVLRMLRQDDKAAEHDRLAANARNEPLPGGGPLLKLLTEPASSGAAATAAAVPRVAAAADSRSDSAPPEGEDRPRCPVCDERDHQTQNCPYLLCSKCRTWGHLPRHCESNAVNVPRGAPLPQSLLDWESVFAERPDESAWPQQQPQQQPHQQVPESPAPAAYVSRVRSPEKRVRRDVEERRGGDSGYKPRVSVCHHCNQEGHMRPDCPLLHHQDDRRRHSDPPHRKDDPPRAASGGGRVVGPPASSSGSSRSKRDEDDRPRRRSRSRSRSPNRERRKAPRGDDEAFCQAFLAKGKCDDPNCTRPHIRMEDILAAAIGAAKK